MSDNRIEGAGNQFTGSVKEGVGKLTGNDQLQAEGLAQKAGGSVQNAAGKVEDSVESRSFSDNRAEGTGKKVVGSIKEGVGGLTGNDKLRAEGAADKAEGSVQNFVGKVEDTIKGVFQKK